MRYLSPLRYPGGKARLAPFFAALIRAQDPQPSHYAEPFAGGAGAALHLLHSGVVEHIHINDIHPGIAAFWRSVTTSPDAFIECLTTTPVTVKEWHRQRTIFNAEPLDDDLAFGFATFFLNRTNRSGILKARPIGGLDQTGQWKIDARYNIEGLSRRIRAVADMADKITVTQLDGLEFIDSLQSHGSNLFLYADPPYVVQGDKLYLRAFNDDAHAALAERLAQSTHPWILTYDDEPLIWDGLYKQQRAARFNIAHTAQRGHVGKETIVYGPNLTVPDGLEITPGVSPTWINPKARRA